MMSRLLVHNILAILIVLFTAAPVIQVHMCQGAIVGVAVNHEAEPCCEGMSRDKGCCSMDRKANHCSDEVMQLPVLSDFLISGLNFSLFLTEVELHPANREMNITACPVVKRMVLNPPLILKYLISLPQLQCFLL